MILVFLVFSLKPVLPLFSFIVLLSAILVLWFDYDVFLNFFFFI